MPNILAFIPARGGSKGIPQKNIYSINGKPLIYYTLDIVKKLKESVIPFLSTDEVKIKSYCESEGFYTDYLRPSELSSDTSSTIDALIHGLNWYEENHGLIIDAVLLLQPTSPIRIVDEINKAIQLFTKEKLNSLISVTEMREHPYECIKINSGSDDWDYLEEPIEKVTRRQDYKDKYYFIDGSFYLAKKDFIYKHKSFISKDETFLFESKIRYSIDIDTIEDLYIAESILKKGNYT